MYRVDCETCSYNCMMTSDGLKHFLKNTPWPHSEFNIRSVSKNRQKYLLSPKRPPHNVMVRLLHEDHEGTYLANRIVAAAQSGHQCFFNPNPDDGTTLFHHALRLKNPRLLSLLAQIYTNPTYGLSLDANTVTNSVVKENRLEDLKMILELGCEQMWKEGVGETSTSMPLHLAVIQNYKEATEMLIGSNEREILKPSRTGFTVLHVAVGWSTNPSTIRMLMECGHPEFYRASDNGITPLTFAVRRGYPMVVEMMLEMRSRVPPIPNSVDHMILILAIKHNHQSVVHTLLSSNEDFFYTRTVDGFTALQLAVKKGFTEIVRILLNSKKECFLEPTEDGQTAMHLAALENRVEIAQILIQSGAIEFQRPDNLGVTALHVAAKAGHVEMVRLLLDSGQKCFRQPSNNTHTHRRYAFFLAVLEGHEMVVRTMLDSGIEDVYDPHGCEMTAMFVAARFGRVGIARILVNSGLKCFQRPNPKCGSPAMDTAIQYCQTEMIHFFMEPENREVFARNHLQGFNALHSAIIAQKLNMLKLLLKYDEEGLWNSGPKCSSPAIILTAADDKHKMLQAILDSGLEYLLKPARNGYSVLHAAAKVNSPKIMRILLTSGKNCFFQPTNKGLSALHVAAEHGHLRMVNMLLKARFCGIIPNMDFRVPSVLYMAAQNGHTEVVRALMNSGLPDIVDPPNLDFPSPLDAAARGGHTEIIRILLDRPDVEVILSGETQEIVPLSENDDENGNSYHVAIRANRVESIQTLLECNYPLFQTPDLYGHTPLILAIREKKVELVRHMLYSVQGPEMVTHGNSIDLLVYAINSSECHEICFDIIRIGSHDSHTIQRFIQQLLENTATIHVQFVDRLLAYALHLYFEDPSRPSNYFRDLLVSHCKSSVFHCDVLGVMDTTRRFLLYSLANLEDPYLLASGSKLAGIVLRRLIKRYNDFRFPLDALKKSLDPILVEQIVTCRDYFSNPEYSICAMITVLIERSVLKRGGGFRGRRGRKKTLK